MLSAIIVALGLLSVPPAFGEETLHKPALHENQTPSAHEPIPNLERAEQVPGLRELETDRPDKTESTLTVDKGHFQLEVELASFTHSKDEADSMSFGNFELRYGLTNSFEIQAIYTPFTRELHGGGSEPSDLSGGGDPTLRFKWNLMGNDGTRPGLALIPFYKIPVAQGSLGNQHGEGGLLIPMKLIFAHEIELAFELGGAAVRNKDNSDTVFQTISSYSLGHALWNDDLHGYLEFYSESSPKEEWVATIDTGLTYQIGANMQVDAGVNIGVSEAADPWNPFVGYSVRF